MFRALIAKEILQHLTSGRFVLSAAIVALFSLVAVAGMSFDAALQRADVRAMEEENRRLINAAQGNLRDLLDHQVVVRPVPDLRTIAVGAERNAGEFAQVDERAIRHGGGHSLTAFLGDALKNPVFSMFPAWDLAGVMAMVLSLVVFVAAHDTIAGEREGGTLTLLLSNPLPRDMLVLAKWLGGAAAMCVPVTLAFLFTCVWLITAGETMGVPQPSGPAEWAAIGCIYVTTLLYTCAVYSIAVFVSVRSRRSQTAITILLLLWVGAVLVAPTAAPHVAAAAPDHEPADLTASRDRAEAAALDETITLWRSVAERVRAEGLNPYRDEGRQRRRELWRESEDDLARSIAEKVGRERREYLRQQNAHESLTQWLSRALSPSAAYTFAVTRLADTGPEHSRRVNDAVRDHMAALAVYYDDLEDRRDRERAGTFDDLPRFRLAPEPLPARLAGALTDISVLLLVSLVFFAGTFVSFVRMDVTA